MESIKKFIKNNAFLLTSITLLFIVVMIIIISDYINNNKKVIKLSGYYYEETSKTSASQDIYYFEKNGNCYIKSSSIISAGTTINVNEEYVDCKYKIKNNIMEISFYDNSNYNNLKNIKKYKIKYLNSNIRLDDVKFIKTDNDNTKEFKENRLKNYGLTCASNVAKEYKVADYCTTWEKVSEGFYIYNCGINIRIFIEDTGISYDTYNPKLDQFTEKDYCYKIVTNVKNERKGSDEVITKNLPLKAVFNGNIEDGYMIDSTEIIPNNITLNDKESVLKNMEFFPVDVDIKGLNSNKTFEIKLPNTYSYKDNSLDKIKVIVNVGKKSEKEFIINANYIKIFNLNNNLKANSIKSYDKIKVKLYGTENNLNEINDVNSYIDLKEYGIAGIYEVPIKLNVDENIYDYILEPSKVQIKIS